MTSRVTYTLVAFAAALGTVGMGPPLGGPSDTHGLDRADVKLTARHPGGQAGFTGLGSGDLDGDGFEDVVVGAMFDDTNGESAGAVYVAYGPVAREADLSSEAKLLGELPGDFAGETLEASHDLDRDGFDDLVVGAPGGGPSQPGMVSPGQVYILYGSAERLTGTADLPDVADAVLVGEHVADTLGHSLDALDLDGDGWSDLAVAASGFGGVFPGGLGKVHLVHGGPDRIRGTVEVATAADAALLGEHHGSLTGFRIQRGGDLDGDGTDELLIGAQLWGGTTGAAYLVHGGQRRSGTSSLALAADARIAGAQPTDIAGTALAGGGDLDGDGLDDIAVGAPTLDRPGTAYLFYGTANRISGDLSVTDADAAIVGEAAGDGFGRGLAISGDLDRDGLADLVIGAPGNDTASEDAGSVYVLPAGRRLDGPVAVDDVAWLTLTGEAAGDEAGYGLHGTGDLNRDGRADLLASAHLHDAGSDDAGAVYGIVRIARDGSPGRRPSLPCDCGHPSRTRPCAPACVAWGCT